MTQFDLDSLYDALIKNPFSINNDFNVSVIDGDDERITIEMSNGEIKNIDSIEVERPEYGIVTTSDTVAGDLLTIQFFAPCTFENLNT